MRLQTYRDEHRLLGNHRSLDLVTIAAAGLLLAGFACAFVALLAR
jgi:hypothetical protein